MTNYIVAKNYLCFMALLEMIVSETDSHVHFTQKDFAEMFGITVPIGTHISIKNVQYSNNSEKHGTNIRVEEINDFFKENGIPLQMSYVSSCYFDEMTFTNMIFEKSKNSHIVFAFCYGLLYNEVQNDNIGHVVLLEDVDIKSDLFKIYDPGPRNYGSKFVKVDDMLFAMKRRGGIYIFQKTDA